MLEQVIKRKFYLAKHLAAPLLKEREEYMQYLHGKGLTRSYLLSIADYTLRIVQLLNLKDGTKEFITLSAIEQAANKWADMELNHPMRRSHSPASRVKFIRIATVWLKRIGRLEAQFEDSETLINEIFVKSHIKRRYLSAPFLEKRLAYILQWKNNGASIAQLREIANYQIHIIHYLHLTELREITETEVRNAARLWSNEYGVQKRIDNYSRYAEARFLRFSKGWLESMGLMPEQPNGDEIPFMDCLTEYLDNLLKERGCSIRTVESRYSLLKFFLKDTGIRCGTLMELTPSVIDDILVARHELGGCSRRTVATLATVYRSFLRYASSRGWCRAGLAETIKSPRTYHLESLPSAPNWDDIQRVISKKHTDNHTDIRDYAILLLLSVYGLRSSELIGLKLKDFDWENERLYLRRAKGSKSQIFPLLKSVGDAVIRYIKESRQNESRSEFLFLCRRAPYRAMSTTTVYAVVRRSLEPFGLNIKHHGPHCLRHGCATHLINSGFSLKEIADQLGHQQLDTTRIYAKVNIINLRKVAAMDWEGLL